MLWPRSARSSLLGVTLLGSVAIATSLAGPANATAAPAANVGTQPTSEPAAAKDPITPAGRHLHPQAPANPDAATGWALPGAPSARAAAKPFVSKVAKVPAVPVVAKPQGMSTKKSSPAVTQPVGSYVGQTSCDPETKPGLAAFRDLVLATYKTGADWGIGRNCSDDTTSEHLEGRAWDWMARVPSTCAPAVRAQCRKEYAAATQLLNWLTAKGPDGTYGYNARRVGVMYINYNHQLWRAYVGPDGKTVGRWWTSNYPNPHVDHVHFSFTWAGAYKRTSFWTGRAAAEDFGPCRFFAYPQPAPLYSSKARNKTPCPEVPAAKGVGAKKPVLWRGSANATVRTLQGRLGVRATGTFDRATQLAVLKYQRAHASLPRTGAVDVRTRASLVAARYLSR